MLALSVAVARLLRHQYRGLMWGGRWSSQCLAVLLAMPIDSIIWRVNAIEGDPHPPALERA